MGKITRTDSKTRFSNRVDNYIKYRPHYPHEMIDYLKEQKALTGNSIVADIGSGTGISSEHFLENGNTVYGVEPNREMREAAERLLANHTNFKSINGSAEETTLASRSIDLIIAGQAFHWFEVQKAKTEFNRIIKTGGYCALIWNIKKSSESSLMQDYEMLMLKHGRDYKKLRHENTGEKEFNILFENGYTAKFFDNEQVMDYEGLRGRILSASYIPPKGEPGYEHVIKDIDIMFHKHSENNLVKIFYVTEVVWGKI